MTTKVAKTRIVKDKETGEWVVKAYGPKGERLPEADYFTTDKTDATQTAALMVKPAEVVVLVDVRIEWGKEWNGSYYAETPGVGRYVTVMSEITNAYGFRGCPLGSGGTVETAIADFVSRGRAEWNGPCRLEVSHIKVNRTTDFRTSPPTRS